MIKTRGVSHVNLAVRSLSRSAAFYQQVFGMEEIVRYSTFASLRTPGAADVLSLDENAELAEKAGDNGGITHWGFLLQAPDALDAAIAEVEGAGGKLLERGEHLPGAPFAYVQDPDGYTIELVFDPHLPAEDDAGSAR